jgi:bifunctional non-homologous end joining protein LigD
VVDGEIVVLNDNGFPDFQLLQHYDGNRHRPIQYHVFDILFLNGKDLCNLPLIERKEILRKELPENDVIKYSDHVETNGLSFFEVTREQGLEGMMAKRADSSYFPGKRTGDWLKVKHNQTQEAIIGGYTPPSGGRKFFGSLVLGMMEDGKLRYIGNSGSGFNYQSLKELYERMQPLVQDTSPFKEKVKDQKHVTWVKPVLVCEIKFTEVTKDGKLRHPIFMHIREDKSAKEVTMANTAAAPPKKKAAPEKKAAAATAPEKKTAPKQADKDDGGKVFQFGSNKVKASNVSKIYFPEDGINKGDVIEYYISMGKYILPYLKGRPESLLRNPNGIHAKGFFHKDAGEATPSFVKSQKIYSESANKDIDYIVCDNQATLTYLNNLGCIEINPWHSTLKALDNPDYLIIDIDPSEKNTFEQVVDAACVVKEILDRAGAEGFCKTSGSSGLHIYIPTGKKYSYEQVKDFAYLVCMLAEQQIPSFTTLERSLQKRRNDRIYMDYLQNRKGQTIACAYSLRPKPGGTVSCPLEWKEVKRGLSPKQFTIHNMLERVQKKGDLFTGILGKGIDLNKCLKKLGA